MNDHELAPEDVEWVQIAAARMERYISAACSFSAKCVENPSLGSPLQQHSDCTDAHLFSAYTMGLSYLTLSADHLLAFQQLLLCRRFPVAAWFTIVRGSVEASS